MTTFIFWLILISIHLLNRFGEYRIHRSNYDFLVFAGGEELQPKFMLWFYGLGILVVPSTFLEFLWIHEANLAASSPLSLQLMSVSMLTASLFLRYWAIESLGVRWSMRCIFVNGYPKSQKGPYKFINHPEYLARLLDLVAIPLFLGSWFSLTMFAISFLFLASLVVKNETYQIKRLSQQE